MRLPISFPIVLFFLLMGCVKPTVDSDVSAGTDKIYLVPLYPRQSETQDLTVNLYLNKEDYYENRNIVKTYIIPGNADKLEVELDSNTTYYYDVYADDQTMSNWAIWPYGNKSFKIHQEMQEYPISNNANNIHRALLLSDNKQSSKWIAVGSFNKVGNSWDTMSAEARNKNIVFNRSQKAIFTDGSNVRKFSFGVSADGIAKNAFAIKFYETDDMDLIDYQYQKAYMTCKGPISPEYRTLSPYSHNSTLVLPVTDTFFLTSDAFKHTFIMVRKK